MYKTSVSRTYCSGILMPVTMTFSEYFYNSVTNICFDNEEEMRENSIWIPKIIFNKMIKMFHRKIVIQDYFSLYFYVWWSSKTNRIVKQKKEYLGTNIVRRKEPRKEKSKKKSLQGKIRNGRKNELQKTFQKNWVRCAVAVYLGS